MSVLFSELMSALNEMIEQVQECLDIYKLFNWSKSHESLMRIQSNIFILTAHINLAYDSRIQHIRNVAIIMGKYEFGSRSKLSRIIVPKAATDEQREILNKKLNEIKKLYKTITQTQDLLLKEINSITQIQDEEQTLI